MFKCVKTEVIFFDLSCHHTFPAPKLDFFPSAKRTLKFESLMLFNAPFKNLHRSCTYLAPTFSLRYCL
jgi:hypothetical protein